MTYALPLLLALSFSSEPAAALPDAEVVEAIDFARLKPADAARLEGQRVRWRVRASLGRAAPFGVLHDVEVPGDRLVLLVLPTAVPDGEMTVEAELHLEYRTPKVLKVGTQRPARWVYRLEAAAVVPP